MYYEDRNVFLLRISFFTNSFISSLDCMKLYKAIEHALTIRPELRNSDKELIWEVMKQMGLVKTVNFFGEREAILKENFVSGDVPSLESITRARRKVQELQPGLEATSSRVKRKRKQIENTKGTFIFGDKVNVPEWEN